MLLLALDTSSGAVTAAVHDGERTLAQRITLDARRHAELLAPSIEGVLAEAKIDRRELTAVAVGVGPGPFTGLRVGLVTAQVLGHALGIPVYGVCSLDALAHQAVEAGTVSQAAVASTAQSLAASAPAGENEPLRFLVAADARRHEVYWASYTASPDGIWREQGPAVGAAAGVPREGRPVVGRGAELYPADLGPALEPWEPSAAAVAGVAVRGLAGRSDLLLPVQPLYLRRPDAVASADRARTQRG